MPKMVASCSLGLLISWTGACSCGCLHAHASLQEIVSVSAAPAGGKGMSAATGLARQLAGMDPSKLKEILDVVNEKQLDSIR